MDLKHVPTAEKKSEKAESARIHKTFYDPSTGLWATNARNKTAPSALKHVESLQRTHRPRKKKLFAPTGGPPGTYLADIVFLDEALRKANGGFGSILTVLQANTRMAYARPLKKKTAAEVSKALTEIVAEVKDMRILRTDMGKEFINKTAEKMLAQHKIKHVEVTPGNHAPLARLDRFHGTLRTLIERWHIVAKTDDWVKVLPKLIQNYNSTKHTTTKVAPEDADEETIREQDMQRAADVRAVVTQRMAPVVAGRPVLMRRVLNRALFAKGTRPKWSKKTFELGERKGANRYMLKGTKGEFKAHELLRVPGVVVAPPQAEPAPAPVARAPARRQRRAAQELKREEMLPENVQRMPRSRAPNRMHEKEDVAVLAAGGPRTWRKKK